MSDGQIENKRNDMRLLTPNLMMALIVACGFVYFAFGAAPANG